MSPNSGHISDWFYITMKITIMRQMVKGLSKKHQNKLGELLDSIKWNIWHGNVDKALDRTVPFCDNIEREPLDKDSYLQKLWK